MRIGIVGSGMVAVALADRLLELGNEVRMGSRAADGPASQWAGRSGERANSGDFVRAAHLGGLATARGTEAPPISA